MNIEARRKAAARIFKGAYYAVIFVLLIVMLLGLGLVFLSCMWGKVVVCSIISLSALFSALDLIARSWSDGKKWNSK